MISITVPPSNDLYKTIIQAATIQFHEDVDSDAVDTQLLIDVENNHDVQLGEVKAISSSTAANVINEKNSWTGRYVVSAKENTTTIKAGIRNDTGTDVMIRLGGSFDYEKT